MLRHKKNGLKFLWMLLFGALLMVSCKDKQADVIPELVVSKTAYNVVAGGEDLAISLKASGDYAVIIPAAAKEWLSVKSQDRTGLVLTIEKNTVVASRTSTIVLKLVNQDKAVQIAITQVAGEKIVISDITTDQSSVTFASTGGDAVINVNTDAEYVVEIPQSEASWLSLKSKSATEVVLTATPTVYNVERSSEVTLRLTAFDKSCKVVAQQGYALQVTMQAPASLIGADFHTYTAINNYMLPLGYEYTENSNAMQNDDPNGIHGEVVYDAALGKAVFKLSIHANAQVLDRDRGLTDDKYNDRQRNEIKTQFSTQWNKMNGNYDEWQLLRWKMKIPSGFRPTSSFTHIHQLKGTEGEDIGNPLITISLRADKTTGANRRVQVIHTPRTAEGTKAVTIVDNIPIADFEDQWVQIEEEAHYVLNGYYRIKITRISDGKVLINYTKSSGIDMWRALGTVNIRNKYGIYRSLGPNLAVSGTPSYTHDTWVPTPLGIKDESIFLADFEGYLKNRNPNPQAHD